MILPVRGSTAAASGVGVMSFVKFLYSREFIYLIYLKNFANFEGNLISRMSQKSCFWGHLNSGIGGRKLKYVHSYKDASK